MADEVKDIQTPVIDKVAESFWSGKVAEAPPPTDNPPKLESNDNKPPEDEFELIDPNIYLKQQLGFDDWDVAKTEYENLKKIRENPFEETYKKLDDDSRKVLDYIKEKKEDELLDYFQTRKVLSNLDNLQPDAALKLYIQQVNKALNYTAQDVDDVFKEKYSIPKKPVQGIESDEDFAQIENEWKEQKEFVERKIQRDSLAAKQELSKLLPTINLQDIGINANQQQNEQAQKDLEATQAKVKAQFDEILNSEFKNFNGLTINFKDDQTEIPVSFIPTDEQKATLKSDIENFDADEVLGSRWFDKDGKPNIQQAMMDMLYFKFGLQIFQKLVQDSGAKRLEAHVKSVKNVSDFSNGNQSQQTNGKPNPSQLLDAVGEALWTSHR